MTPPPDPPGSTSSSPVWGRNAAHQPVEFHQPGADRLGPQQAVNLHEQRHRAVFVIHRHRKPTGDGQGLQLLGLISMQGDRLLQQEMLAGLKSAACQPNRGAGGVAMTTASTSGSANRASQS